MVQSINKKIEMKNKEISDPNEIVNEIKRIFKKVICKGFAKSLPQVDNF